jgi:hypothetical protein
VSICRALAEHEKREAFPEAVAAARVDFADLQDADDIPASAESAAGGRTIRSPRLRPDHDQSRRHFLYRDYSHPDAIAALGEAVRVSFATPGGEAAAVRQDEQVPDSVAPQFGQRVEWQCDVGRN